MEWAGTAQSVSRLATGWTVRGSNPDGWGEIFRTRPDRLWGPPSLLYTDIINSEYEEMQVKHNKIFIMVL